MPLVLDHEGEHSSHWAAVSLIAAKIGCTSQTLHEWVDWFNNRRLLEPIGRIPPAKADERYYGHAGSNSHGRVTQRK